MPFEIPNEDFHGGFWLPKGEGKFYIVDSDYDAYTGKYAFCSPKTDKELVEAYEDYMTEYATDDEDVSDEEYETAAQEAHDELVRSLIEAGGEIRELKAMLREAKDALLYMLTLHKVQDILHCSQEKVILASCALQSEPDQWTPERADEVFKKISDYLEQEKTNDD